QAIPGGERRRVFLPQRRAVRRFTAVPRRELGPREVRATSSRVGPVARSGPPVRAARVADDRTGTARGRTVRKNRKRTTEVQCLCGSFSFLISSLPEIAAMLFPQSPPPFSARTARRPHPSPRQVST